jgi:nitroreductase
MRRRARKFYHEMKTRRSIRQFSSRRVRRELIDLCVRTAHTAPSGANCQPWHFVVISDAVVKRRVRRAAEAEERKFYRGQSTREWVSALATLGTGPDKPFLEVAPYLIVVFMLTYGVGPEGQRIMHYYPSESVGLAAGFLIAALHQVGLATLTYTPSPMRFLNRLLGRPAHERPFLILATGHPASGAVVPKLTRKRFEEVTTFL